MILFILSLEPTEELPTNMKDLTRFARNLREDWQLSQQVTEELSRERDGLLVRCHTLNLQRSESLLKLKNLASQHHELSIRLSEREAAHKHLQELRDHQLNSLVASLNTISQKKDAIKQQQLK